MALPLLAILAAIAKGAAAAGKAVGTVAAGAGKAMGGGAQALGQIAGGGAQAIGQIAGGGAQALGKVVEGVGKIGKSPGQVPGVQQPGGMANVVSPAATPGKALGSIPSSAPTNTLQIQLGKAGSLNLNIGELIKSQLSGGGGGSSGSQGAGADDENQSPQSVATGRNSAAGQMPPDPVQANRAINAGRGQGPLAAIGRGLGAVARGGEALATAYRDSPLTDMILPGLKGNMVNFQHYRENAPLALAERQIALGAMPSAVRRAEEKGELENQKLKGEVDLLQQGTPRQAADWARGYDYINRYAPDPESEPDEYAQWEDTRDWYMNTRPGQTGGDGLRRQIQDILDQTAPNSRERMDAFQEIIRSVGVQSLLDEGQAMTREQVVEAPAQARQFADEAVTKARNQTKIPNPLGMIPDEQPQTHGPMTMAGSMSKVQPPAPGPQAPPARHPYPTPTQQPALSGISLTGRPTPAAPAGKPPQAKPQPKRESSKLPQASGYFGGKTQPTPTSQPGGKGEPAKLPTARPFLGGDSKPVERGPSGLPVSKPFLGGAGKGMAPGTALSGIVEPSPQQIDAALTQVEGAGAVTTRNAGKVQQSQAAPKDTLAAAARAVKSYKTSQEYMDLSRTTGRLLNETDLSAEIKTILSQQSSSDQKRLLQLIHRHGEASVLAALQKHQKPQGEY